MKSDGLVTKEGEVEKILSLAEELQDNCERYSYRISMFRIVEFTTILLGITILLFFFKVNEFDIVNFYGLLSVLVSIFIILASFIYTIEYIIVRNYIKSRRRDSRALYEIVEMLRELGEVQGKNEGWSELDRAQYRIRLSRFGIGDGNSDFPHRNFMRKSYKYNKAP